MSRFVNKSTLDRTMGTLGITLRDPIPAFPRKTRGIPSGTGSDVTSQNNQSGATRVIGVSRDGLNDAVLVGIVVDKAWTPIPVKTAGMKTKLGRIPRTITIEGFMATGAVVATPPSLWWEASDKARWTKEYVYLQFSEIGTYTLRMA